MENLIVSTESVPDPDLPSDLKHFKIKNLDTGEEFVIGENDPDFEFDSFELCCRETKRSEKIEGDGNGIEYTDTAEVAPPENEQIVSSWWERLVAYVFSDNSKHNKHEVTPNAASASEFKTPFTQLSSFKFRRELGRGAFGRVLLAQAKIDGKLYAMKIISKKDMRTSDRRQAKAERDILHAMGHTAPHPFTAGLKFAFQSAHNLYLGMDYFPGGNLRELIKKYGYLPEDWVRFYSSELVLAIAHLHSLHVLYRDIKPHNLMLDAKGHVVLIDFGLSKQAISHPRGALSLVGTPDYSAPEVLKTGVHQIEQHKRMKAAAEAAKWGRTGGAVGRSPINSTKNIGYGKAADWWSLGVMIYEMLSGTPVFRGSDLRDTYQRVLYAELEFKPPERFSHSARLLIGGLLRRDPSIRLGAWENPPADIMRQAFFKDVDWDRVLRKDKDGPWIAADNVFAEKWNSSTRLPTEPVRAAIPELASTSPGDQNAEGTEAAAGSSIQAEGTDTAGAVWSPPEADVFEQSLCIYLPPKLINSTVNRTQGDSNHSNNDFDGNEDKGAIDSNFLTSPATDSTLNNGHVTASVVEKPITTEVLAANGIKTHIKASSYNTTSPCSPCSPEQVADYPQAQSLVHSQSLAQPQAQSQSQSRTQIELKTKITNGTTTTSSARNGNLHNIAIGSAVSGAVSIGAKARTPPLTSTTPEPRLDEEDDEDEEIVPNRDSIFISSRSPIVKGVASVVPDWSFMDMNALSSAVDRKQDPVPINHNISKVYS